MENGYHLYDFKGELLREEHIDKFKQWQWRPRPPSLLSKEEQKQIRKNLREYSRIFDQEDAERGASADLAVVEERRRQLDEWYAWRADVEAELEEERIDRGIAEDPVETLLKLKAAQNPGDAEEEQVIEEIVEEVLEEHEDIVN